MANGYMSNPVEIVLVAGVEKSVQTVFCPILRKALPIWLKAGQVITPYFTGEVINQDWKNEKKGTHGVQTFCFMGDSITRVEYDALTEAAKSKIEAKELAKEAKEMLMLQIQLAQIQNAANAPVSHLPLTVGV